MIERNTLIRSEGCPTCGAEMLWTQNAWHSGDATRAAYRCVSGHVIDPATTKQCPQCGVHDTTLLPESDGRQQYRCLRCDCRFQVPR
jgi:transposase-like protein